MNNLNNLNTLNYFSKQPTDSIYYAGTGASLDLNFARNKSLMDRISGNNLVTFTRASGGTYVGSDGLIKTATTNLLLRSEEFDNASWTKNNASITANTIVAPDGTLTGDKLVENTANSQHYVQQTFASTSGTYTYSCFMKSAERSRGEIFISDGATGHIFVCVDLTDGSYVIGTSSGSWSNYNFSITSVSNGWYRVSVTGTQGAGTVLLCRIRLYESGTISSYTGDGYSGIYIWGAQLEQSATVGEYIPTGATINSAPRFDHDPTTGESLGLLLEEQRTNLITSSEDIAGYFTEQNSTPTSNATTAPDGTTTAELIVPNTALASHTSFNTSLTLAASTTYSYSIFVKPNGYIWFQLLFTSGFNNLTAWVNFNLTGAGSFGFTGGGELSKKIEAYPNGWYRCTITATSGSSPFSGGPAYLVLDSDRNARDANYAGNNTSGVYLWGAQLEAGAFPTSYIPTTTAAATRAADVASISGSNFSSWYRQDEGTVFVEFLPRANATAGVAYLNNGGVGEATRIFYNSMISSYTFSVRAAGSEQSSMNNLGAYVLQSERISAAYKVNDLAASRNGGASISDTSATLPTGIDRLELGTNQAANYLNGTIRRLTYFPQRISNENLQRITQ